MKPTDRQFEIARDWLARDEPGWNYDPPAPNLRAVLAWLFSEVERLTEANDWISEHLFKTVGDKVKPIAAERDALKAALLSAPEPKHCDASGVRSHFVLCDAEYADWYSINIAPLKVNP